MALILYVNPEQQKQGKLNGSIYQNSMYGNIVSSAGTAGYTDTSQRKKQKDILAISSKHYQQLTIEEKLTWDLSTSATIDTYRKYMELQIGNLMNDEELQNDETEIFPISDFTVTNDTEFQVMHFGVYWLQEESSAFAIVRQTNWVNELREIKGDYVKTNLKDFIASEGNDFPVSYNSNRLLLPPAPGYRCRFKISITQGIEPYKTYVRHFILMS